MLPRFCVPPRADPRPRGFSRCPGLLVVEAWEKVFFFVSGVPGRCLAKVLQGCIERAPVLSVEVTALDLGRHRQQSLKEPFNAAMTVR